MPAGRLCIESQVEPARALRLGAALTEAVSAEQPVAMYAATLSNDALVLGAYQLAAQALPSMPEAQRGPTLRRRSGGATVRAGAGISYVALALHDRSALMACPPQRLLNRNVRGCLQGLRLAAVQANYFGRDFLSLAARPAVYVGWAADDAGSVLLEFFLSEQRSCWLSPHEIGYPPRTQDGLRGNTPTTLEEAGANAHGSALLEKLAEGHAKQFAVAWQPTPSESLPAADSPSDKLGERRLFWSTPREEAIGFVSAGVALDAVGKLASVRLAGDFFAHQACAITLERMLLGVRPSADMVGPAVDAAYAHPQHDFEGVRNLRNLQESILDAADAASRDAAL
jgi:hypothetical protein